MKKPSLILNNCTILTDNTILEQKDIHISNGIIKSITSHTHQYKQIQQSDIPQIHIDGKYVLPGLIDSHIHLIFDGSPNIIDYVTTKTTEQFQSIATQNLTKYLSKGITAVRDMGDTHGIISTIKSQQTNASSIPLIKNAGDMLTAQYGHVKTIGRPIHNIDTILPKEIQKQYHQQSNLIKLIISGGLLSIGSRPFQTEMDNTIIDAAIQTAHSLQLTVAAHAYSDQDIQQSIHAGIKSIEHGIGASNTTLEIAAKKQVIFTPTLKAVFDLLDNKDQIPEYIRENAESVKDKFDDFFQNAIVHKVKIAMGTDAGTPFNYHGDNLNELKYLSSYGLSPWDCINAATSIPADLLGISNKYGRIKENYQADLIIFNKNPLNTISNMTTNPFMVIKNGEIVFESI